MVFLCVRRAEQQQHQQTAATMSATTAAGKSTPAVPDKKQHNMLAVPVLFLDDTSHVFYIEVSEPDHQHVLSPARIVYHVLCPSFPPPQKRAKGSALIDQVFQHLELSEKDYFGLQFVQQPGDVIVSGFFITFCVKSIKHRDMTYHSLSLQRWLDPNKAFRKQWPHKLPALPPPRTPSQNAAPVAPAVAAAAAASVDPSSTPAGPPASAAAAAAAAPAAPQPPFHFRVKFYVSDPSRLQEEYTRYQFYLQIKRDIWTARLPCPVNTACLLASYTVQAELGDYSTAEHAGVAYLAGMPLLREQTVEMERRIGELHKLHRGQLPADAEYNYLEHAKKLYMYGVDIHRATDSGGKDISLGVTSLGLVVYQNAVRMNVFSWSKMVKISFKRKDFFIQLRREPSETYDTLLGFGMFSHKRAKALWKSCVEHHSFFRLERPNRLPRFLPLSLGSRFYYSGRTEVQAVQESRQRAVISKVFMRSPSKRLLALQAAGVGGMAAGSAEGTSSAESSTVTPPNGTAAAAAANGNGGASSGGASGQAAPENGRAFRRVGYRPHSDGHRVQTMLGPSSLPRKAWEQQSDE